MPSRARTQTRWSTHASGLAVDLNPFQNPYHRGDLVLPELASAYLDRDRLRPGMIRPGDVVTTAFAAIGWTWGGTWQSPTDPTHFSATGDQRARSWARDGSSSEQEAGGTTPGAFTNQPSTMTPLHHNAFLRP